MLFQLASYLRRVIDPPCPEVNYVERTASSSKKSPTQSRLRPGGVHVPKLQNHERKARRPLFSFPFKTPQTHTPLNLLTVKSKCTRIDHLALSLQVSGWKGGELQELHLRNYREKLPPTWMTRPGLGANAVAG